ncbi:hypothetical protein C8R44DRAFT_992148 [Mycena epipterygia]|nr:hypothetical protein C8R44DRAFT_992148 [Mycena epipterygia]
MDPGLNSFLRSNSAPSAEQAMVIQHLIDAGDTELARLDKTISIVSLLLSELESQVHVHKASLKALRGMSSAIRRFPPEILAHIFIIYRDTDTPAACQWSTRKLGRICSYWRTVVLGTPGLWNRVSLSAPGLWNRSWVSLSERNMRSLQNLFVRSGNLPIHLKLFLGYMAPPPGVTPPVLDIVWDLHLRLRDLHLEIPSDDLTFPSARAFPKLSSLHLVLGCEPADLHTALLAFQQTPFLQSLTLNSGHALGGILTPMFSWARLKTLTFCACSISSDLARDILIQCRGLETAELYNISIDEDNDEPPQQIHTLYNLRELHFSVDDPTTTWNVTLESISTPNLRTLWIQAPYNPGTLEFLPVQVLTALHARSLFNLRHLTLKENSLTTDDLITFLHCLSTLETLALTNCPSIENRLFEAFTTCDPSCDPSPLSSQSLRLPQLRTLSIHDDDHNGDGLDADLLATMVESLAQHVGDPASRFPSLERLNLDIDLACWREVTVEERLAAVRATGFLVTK